jgi:hypothetical protein
MSPEINVLAVRIIGYRVVWAARQVVLRDEVHKFRCIMPLSGLVDQLLALCRLRDVLSCKRSKTLEGGIKNYTNLLRQEMKTFQSNVVLLLHINRTF